VRGRQAKEVEEKVEKVRLRRTNEAEPNLLARRESGAKGRPAASKGVKLAPFWTDLFLEICMPKWGQNLDRNLQIAKCKIWPETKAEMRSKRSPNAA